MRFYVYIVYTQYILQRRDCYYISATVLSPLYNDRDTFS